MHIIFGFIFYFYVFTIIKTDISRHPFLFFCRSRRLQMLKSQCEWGICIELLAKNDILYRFLNAQNHDMLRVPRVCLCFCKKEKDITFAMSFGRGRRIRMLKSQCEWGICIELLAKNDILCRFLNAQTLGTRFWSGPKGVLNGFKKH